MANRAAIEAPSEAPTSAGGAGQVWRTSASSQASTRAASGGPSGSSEPPRPGRSAAITRWVAFMSATTGSHIPDQPPWPCSSTTGGPSPLSSRAVDTPASSTRRSVTGAPASTRRRASLPSVAARASSAIRCLLMADPLLGAPMPSPVIVGDGTRCA